MASRSAEDDKPLPSPPTQSGERITSIPTFLSFDPYPSQSSGARPVSMTSDATSEFWDATSRPISTQSVVPSVTGPAGEAGLPPSRPTSRSTMHVAESKRGSSVRASLPPPPSRRGLAAYNKRDSDEHSRPSSSMSRTHVPSLMAQGFTRPMSPMTLQAQRGSRLGAVSPTPFERPEEEEAKQDSGRKHRYSNASVHTMRDAAPKFSLEDAPPMPGSRGTAYTTSPTDDAIGGDTIAGSETSHAPLTSRQQRRDVPEPLKLSVGGKRLSSTPSQLSPISLRGMLNRRSSRREPHEKLPSNPTSPSMQEKPLPAPLATTHTSAGLGRNYEYFAGNLLFLLSGRILNTRARPLNVVTFILTTLPCTLFFGFSAPWLWHHVSPAIPIIFAYIFFLAESAFFHAALSDPGILPRNLHPHPPNPEEERDPLTPGPPTTEWVMVKTFPGQRRSAPDPESSQGGLTAMEVPTKYCKSCSIWRPPRAHHCRVCDACIETQDHHCVWLNNCVGRRNYRYFFAYVGFASLLALFLLIFSIVHISVYGSRHGIGFNGALSGRTQERVAFAMLLYSLLALPYPGSLFCYHLFLVARGETTREYLNSHKFLPKDRHRPFSMADWAGNWAAVFSRPRPPTYMSFKKPYQPGDQRMGHTVPSKDRVVQAHQEAKESQSRVAMLKERFSVVGTLPRLGSRDNANPGTRPGGNLLSRLSTTFRPQHTTSGPDAPPKESISADNSPMSPAVEMKQLPPLPGQNATTGRSAGPINSTPR